MVVGSVEKLTISFKISGCVGSGVIVGKDSATEGPDVIALGMGVGAEVNTDVGVGSGTCWIVELPVVAVVAESEDLEVSLPGVDVVGVSSIWGISVGLGVGEDIGVGLFCVGSTLLSGVTTGVLLGVDVTEGVGVGNSETVGEVGLGVVIISGSKTDSEFLG